MTRITIAALLKLELPGHDVLLVDGGTLAVGGDTYASRDSLVGVPSAFESLTEGIGDEAPAGVITFLPPDASAASVLNDPANQGSRLRIWTSEVDEDTGEATGDLEQVCDWIVDYSAMSIGQGKRELEIAFVSGGDRLFQLNRGNSLSPTFHRGIHPGEAGLDNASGVETSVAWGAPSPPRGTSAGGTGGYYNGGIAGERPGFNNV